MQKRGPYDGMPYYCETCGFGFGEYLACEETDCKLEHNEAATARALRHLWNPESKEAETLEIDAVAEVKRNWTK